MKIWQRHAGSDWNTGKASLFDGARSENKESLKGMRVRQPTQLPVGKVPCPP